MIFSTLQNVFQNDQIFKTTPLFTLTTYKAYLSKNKLTLRCDGFKYVLSQFGYMHTNNCLPSLIVSVLWFCEFLSRSQLVSATKAFSLLHNSNSSVVIDSNVSNPGSSTYMFGSSQNVLLGSSMQNYLK